MIFKSNPKATFLLKERIEPKLELQKLLECMEKIITAKSKLVTQTDQIICLSKQDTSSDWRILNYTFKIESL